MSEQNKNQNQNHEDTPKTFPGGRASRPSSWKKLLSKRWAYPAAYIAAAAIILTLVWVYQDASQKSFKPDPASPSVQSTSAVSTDVNEQQPESVEVVAQSENIAWPVTDASAVKVVKPFFDEKATADEQAAAMVEYDKTFTANTGIDLSRSDDQAFEVRAALSGKVSRVEKHPLVGNVVEITHDNNLKTVYQSLSDLKVKEGDQVKQNDVIASAGRNELEKDLKTHLHFEVYQDDKPVNPTGLLPKK
ncbi:M23 family metallopeptidase [Paenibacillus polymyxa]|nr:M23 family metallopeptidase [Paenibacillus polymyxa]